MWWPMKTVAYEVHGWVLPPPKTFHALPIACKYRRLAEWRPWMHFKRINSISILIQCHLLVNFISNAPYPWWPTMWSMDCQEHSESGKVRSHLGEGFLTNLISSPVGNAGCRDGFRASWHNCHRVVVKVVVPAFSAEIFSNSRCCWRFTSSS